MIKKEYRFIKDWKKLILNFIFIIFIFGFGISLYKVIKYKIDENNFNKQLDKIKNIVKINEIENNVNPEGIPEEEIPKYDPYFNYMNMNLIDVNFNELKNINEDVKGWIQVGGTNINYPFVQGKDNKYYLTHSFDKSYNTAGWVFLDYRNDLSNFDNKNTIIYAHGMKNKTMFGSIRTILTTGWLNDTNNYVVKLSTEYENTLWQVFSIYRIPTTSDYIQTNFSTDEAFTKFINMLVNRSSYNFNTSVSSADRILTLSTCYNNNEKIVLHAKLIKKETK